MWVPQNFGKTENFIRDNTFFEIKFVIHSFGLTSRMSTKYLTQFIFDGSLFQIEHCQFQQLSIKIIRSNLETKNVSRLL